MIRVLIYLIPLLLALYALIDCIQTDADDVRGLPKIGWIVLIVLVGVIGPLAWLVAGRRRGGRSPLPGWVGSRGAPGAGGAPSRPLAPDDDPDFLGRLGSSSRDRRLDEWEREMQSGPADPSPEPDVRGGDDTGDDTDDGPVGRPPAR
jgi:hypothetical protein